MNIKSINFLSFIKPIILEEINSPISGKIKVIESFGEKRIEVGGLTQSSSYITNLWKHALRKVKNQKSPARIRQTAEAFAGGGIRNILVLGLGGGSIINVLRNNYPDAHIVGVEIDLIMIKLGKKYLGFRDNKNLKIVINDAINFVFKSWQLAAGSWQIIIVDLYNGYDIPEISETKKFIQKLFNSLAPDGIIILNRLYFKNYKLKTELFLDKLKKMYNDVSIYKYLSNYFIYIRK